MVYVAVALICAAYVHCQYIPELRERWLLLAAPFYATISQVLFALHIRKMEQGQVYTASFWYWMVCVNVVVLLLPVVFYGVKLTPMSSAGIVLVASGIMLFHLGSQS